MPPYSTLGTRDASFRRAFVADECSLFGLPQVIAVRDDDRPVVELHFVAIAAVLYIRRDLDDSGVPTFVEHLVANLNISNCTPPPRGRDGRVDS